VLDPFIYKWKNRMSVGRKVLVRLAFVKRSLQQLTYQVASLPDKYGKDA